jgi:hypothetical protein
MSLPTITIGETVYQLNDGITYLVNNIQHLSTQNAEQETKLVEATGIVNALTVTSKKNFDLVATIPAFDGSVKSNVAVFFSKLDQAAMIAGWSNSELLAIARQKLENIL